MITLFGLGGRGGCPISLVDAQLAMAGV
jgi:hypothetical protein